MLSVKAQCKQTKDAGKLGRPGLGLAGWRSNRGAKDAGQALCTLQVHCEPALTIWFNGYRALLGCKL